MKDFLTVNRFCMDISFYKLVGRKTITKNNNINFGALTKQSLNVPEGAGFS